MIPYTEHAHGVYHVMGGLCRISQAFAEVAREEGARDSHLYTGRPSLLDGRRACGVELASGEKIYCDDVVLNADFGHAMSMLFDEKDLRRHKPSNLRKRKFSCSTFMMYLGLDREYDDAEHHTIVFANNYKKNIEDISHGRSTSEDMSVYIRNSSKTDPSRRPRATPRSTSSPRSPTTPATSIGRNIAGNVANTFSAFCANGRPMAMSRRTFAAR